MPFNFPALKSSTNHPSPPTENETSSFLSYSFNRLMEMDPEEVVNLFDSCWFSLDIFKNQSQRSDHLEENPSDQPSISSLQIVHVRSNSTTEELSSMESFTSDNFLSPNSVLVTPPLSGKEATQEEPAPIGEEEQPKKIERTIRAEKGRTKSLSDLEFQELKGFIDLGFVFSEEDTNSSLIEIIPGLHRLGKKDGDQNDQERTRIEGSSVSRPYLSEAWEVLERRRKRENPLLNWRIPALGNEIDTKDSLKWWAHTVASTVG